jgi:hypothetical protein
MTNEMMRPCTLWGKTSAINCYYIKASDGCPLALQVLLGFTTEGVPVNE